ncbi:hypothetical protein AAVH_21419 [Aphelenchoides avenae]|nr:hypothetical protein AAVH_21419 [Aphelenchus avenae]
MPSVMSKLGERTPRGKRAWKRQRRDGLPTPPKKPVHLLGETMLDAALFLDRLDLDAVQFSCKRQRTFVRDNAHLIPLRDLARISFDQYPPYGRVRVLVEPTRPGAGTVRAIGFNGTWEEMLAEKEQFQNAVRYSVARHLKLETPNMDWAVVSELFGDTPPTIRVSNEVLIGQAVKPDIVGIQGFLRPFALVNRLQIAEQNWRTQEKSGWIGDAFLRWCAANSFTHLELGRHGTVLSVLSDDVVLDFCFGPHGADSDPRHLKACFQCSVGFMARLLEANRKCSRRGPVSMDLVANTADAPNVVDLAAYKAEETRSDGFEKTTFLLPKEFDVKIVCTYQPRRPWTTWNCHIEVSRPARPG